MYIEMNTKFKNMVTCWHAIFTYWQQETILLISPPVIINGANPGVCLPEEEEECNIFSLIATCKGHSRGKMVLCWGSPPPFLMFLPSQTFLLVNTLVLCKVFECSNHRCSPLFLFQGGHRWWMSWEPVCHVWWCPSLLGCMGCDGLPSADKVSVVIVASVVPSVLEV